MKSLSRRTFIRVGSLSMGLPVLDIMLNSSGTAYAQSNSSLPKRFALVFGGTSLGCTGDSSSNQIFPSATGRNYTLPMGLSSLADVKSQVSIVSNLLIPVGNSAGSTTSAFHTDAHLPQLTGMRIGRTGASSDQIMLNFLGGEKRGLHYLAQASYYRSDDAPYIREHLCFRADGSPIVNQQSPRAAFNSLFSGFSGTNETPPELNKLQARRKSVLDLLSTDLTKLISQLGSKDKIRMEQYLTEVREIEKKIEVLPPANSTNICSKPSDPGPDPRIGEQFSNTAYPGANQGYSNEDLRAKVFCDLIHMAFACDLTRVATLMITSVQSNMNTFSFTGHNMSVHGVGHEINNEAVAKSVRWHVGQFAYLVAKLRDTPEGAGNMLNNSVICYINEGGFGRDNADSSANSPHSTENMLSIVAGQVGGLRPGQHIDSYEAHPSSLLLTAMRATGYSGNLGEIATTLPQLYL